MLPVHTSNLLELRWKQPLREDEVHALLENVLDKDPVVARQSLRALVRLPLTPRAWSRTASVARVLLPMAAYYDDATYADILEDICRIPDAGLKDTLVDLLDAPLDGSPRRSLLGALARECESRVVRHLLDELEHEFVERRLAAARDLSAFQGLDPATLLSHLAREVDPCVRFWIAVALAMGGDVAPLLMFFQEPRPERWYYWGDVVGAEGAERFVLHERAQLLSEDVRHTVGSVQLNRSDPAASLLRTLAPPASVAVPELSVDRAPSVLDATHDEIVRRAEAEQLATRWIASMPDWQRDAQLSWDDHIDFSKVDARIRGRAISALFAHQFEYLRSSPTREPFAYGSEEDGFVSDGGQIMAILVGRMLDGAVGIDTELLFRLYCEEAQKHVYTEVQLSAAAAYTSPREVMVATRDALVSASPELRRLAAEFIGLARRNVGLGIPTWGGGGPPPDTPLDTTASEECGPDALFYRSKLLVPAEAARGDRVRIVIDLHRVVDEDADVRLAGVIPGWDTLLVEVSVVATGIAIVRGDDAGMVALNSDGSSLPFELEGLVDPEEEQTVLDVVALFSFRGRSCGWARARVRLLGAIEHAPTSGQNGHIAIALEARVPPLTLHLVRGEAENSYAFRISVLEELRYLPGMPDCSHGTCRLRQDELDQILETLDHVAGVPTLDQARATLLGMGDLIYDLLPPAFHYAYVAIRKRLGDMFAIQFVSDDPGFPWELARPRVDGARTNMLCETHPVARWHSYRYNTMRQRLAKDGSILTVAPLYDKKNALPRVQEEAAWLVATLGARRLEPVSREGFLSSLRQSSDMLSVFHVAAHGYFDRTRPLLSKLDLGNEYVNAAEIRGERKDALRTGLVMLNVCDAGASSRILGGAAVGFLDAFVERGAAAVIGPLWSVNDRSAMLVLKSCLPRILDGTPLAEALRDARYADDASIDPFAYVLCGDVTAAFG